MRDYNSIVNAFRGVDYVFHAAALKQVPSCEFYPMEAVRTNVVGSDNVISACVANHVQKAIFLSTDKAAYPINAMGMTKAIMEKNVIARSRQMLPGDPVLCLTRYGNVMASRGSVIPLFCQQLDEGKPLTVTNPAMTRFMMTLEDAVELAEYIRDMGFIPEQAQDFYPTPSTLSTCMYYTGLDPRTMDPVYVPKSPHEKAMQRALIQYRNPENYELVCEALRRTHREDLIGFGPKCLVRPRKMAGETGKPSRGKGSNGKGFGQKTANDRSGQGKAKTGGRPKKTLRNVHKKK